MPNPRTTVKFDVFGFIVIVIRTRDISATGRRLRADLAHAEAAFMTKSDNPMKGWLILGPGSTEGTIAHESAHAVRAMLTAVGAELDDETFAYHLDYLVGRIHSFLKRCQCSKT